MKIVYSYKHVPTLKAFSLDDSQHRAIVGPVGAGKTVACVMEVLQRGQKQTPGPDGVRRVRCAAVRNTFKELEDTTIKTFMEWVPHSSFGNWISSKYNYTIDQITTPDGCPVEIEVMFRALDRPDQLRDLLSLELTFCWFNEMREIGKQIYDLMSTRINRFPRKIEGDPHSGATWSGMFGDSNPPDTDHWMYRLFEEEKPVYCKTCKTVQGGNVYYPTHYADNKTIIPMHERRCPQCDADVSNSIAATRIFRQPSARSHMAENLPNLSPNYYSNLIVGKTTEFIRVYVDGEYGFMVDGRAVYQNFSSQLHVAETEILPVRALPLIIGLDFGRNPAAVFCQGHPIGTFNVIDELCAENMDLREFIIRILKPHLLSYYGGMDICITGDPAGAQRSQTDSATCFRELAAHGLKAIPAPTNSLQARLGAVNTLLTKMIPSIKKTESDTGWRPALQVSPKCKVLLKGFNGGYRMRRLQISGQERYKDEPEKTKEGHCQDALQYASLTYESGMVRVRTSIRSSSGYTRGNAPPVGAFT